MHLVHILVFIVTFGTYGLSVPSHFSCECKISVVTCSDVIPTDLPENTTEVIVYNPHEAINKDSFAGVNWENVSSLAFFSIGAVFRGYTTIANGAFEHLQKLTTLTVNNFHRLTEEDVYSDAFRGMNQLKTLDMSGNVAFGFLEIISRLQNTTPQLEILILRYVESIVDSVIYVPFGTFSDFKAKPIRLLDFSGIKFAKFELGDFPEVFPCLQSLILQDSNSLALVGSSGFTDIRLPLKLRILDISETTLPFGKVVPDKIMINMDFIAHITNLYFNNVFKLKYNISETNLTFIGDNTMQWEILELMANGLIWLNLTVEKGKLNRIRHLTLAFNDMEYLSPNVLLGFETLRSLNLSYNNLKVMQHYSDFGNLLRNLKHLHTLSLKSNGLELVPRDMFISCTELEIIDLAKNRLKTVSLNLKNNLALRFLNFSNNLLMTVSVADLNQFETIYSVSANNVSQFLVDVNNNPFSCSCDTKESSTLMIKMKRIFTDFDKITCKLDGDIVSMDKIIVSDIDDLCTRALKIALYSTGTGTGVLAFLLIAFLVRRCYEKMRVKRSIKRLILQYKNEDREDEYLVFLCCCSEDHGFVNERVRDELNNTLKRKLETEKDLVCLGDMQFLAGRRIEDEIVRHIDASKVIMLLVSNSFCDSPWCNYETMVAYYDQKPLILMFKEEVERRHMPSILSKLYRRYTRVVWKEIRGELTLCHGWDHLCDAIITMGAE